MDIRNPLPGAAMAIALVVGLSACGTSSKITRANAAPMDAKFTYHFSKTGGMPSDNVEVITDQLDRRLAEVLVKPGASDSYRVEISVTKYRMRNGATRALVGIFAGTDSLDSNVSIKDASGNVLGQVTVETGNVTAWGTTTGLLESHADDIADFVLAQAGRPASAPHNTSAALRIEAQVEPTSMAGADTAAPSQEARKMKWQPRNGW